MSLLKTISHTISTRFLQSATNFILAVLLARWLGADGKGMSSLLLLNLTFIVLVQNLFGGGALVYLIPKWGWLRIKKYAIIWAVLSSLIMALLIQLFSETVVNWYWLFLIGIMQNLATCYQHLLLAREKIKQANWQLLAQSALVFLAAVGAFLILDGFSIPAYAICLSLGFSSALIIGYIHGEKNLPETVRPEGNVIQDSFKLGLYSQAANAFQLANYRLSYYFIERLFSMATLGLYSILMNLADLIWMPSRSLATILYSRVANESSHSKRLKDLRDFSWMSIGFTALGCLVLAFIPDGLYQWFFGDEFVGIQEAGWYLIPGIMALGSANALVHYFNGIGKQRLNSLASGLGLICTLIGLFTILPKYGLIGAAITCSISYSASALLLVLMTFISKQSVLAKK